MTDTPEAVASIAAKLLGTVNAPEQEIYRVSREIAEMIATRPDADLVRQLVEAGQAYFNAEEVVRNWPPNDSTKAFDRALRAQEIAEAEWRSAVSAARAAGYGGDHG